MIKWSRFSGEHEGELLVQPIHPGERVKTASYLLPSVQKLAEELRPSDQYTYVLVNAMGYSEFYGANSNKDYYGYNPHLNFNGLLHDWEGIGDAPVLDRMKGKAWAHGYPCFYNAAVYAHHRNTDPTQLGFGDVILSAANPRMKRIELVLRISNEEAQKKGHSNILSRIRNGERTDVSMGARVPYDTCSICTDWAQVRTLMDTFDPSKHAHKGIPVLHAHKKKAIRGVARTRAEYCNCMKTKAGKILPDGKKVFVYNDHPRFFDISFVWVGADRTARVMWHLQGDNPMNDALVKSASNKESIVSAIMTKVSQADLRKIGEMEKDVPGGFAESILKGTDQDKSIAPEALRKLKEQCGGTKPLLSTLSAAGIVLKPEEFQRVIDLPDKEDNTTVRALSSMGRVFDTNHSGIDDSLAVSTKDVIPDVLQALGPLLESRSSYSPFLVPRLSRVTIVVQAKPKVDTGKVSTKVASLYNGYRLSLIENVPKMASLGLTHLIGSLDDEMKIAALTGKQVLALLLGTGSLVSLVSSHLRREERAGKELGIVSKFVADHPTMTSAITAGAGLRAAMGIQAAGGVAGAAEALVNAAGAV